MMRRCGGEGKVCFGVGLRREGVVVVVLELFAVVEVEVAVLVLVPLVLEVSLGWFGEEVLGLRLKMLRIVEVRFWVFEGLVVGSMLEWSWVWEVWIGDGSVYVVY